MDTHIAVDIGASSGRLVLGRLKHSKLVLEEIHRFDNGFRELDGSLYWDIEHLLEQIVAGLQAAKKAGVDSCTLGIDTWAVDYALVDREGRRLREVYAYRDRRTDSAPAELEKLISREALYEKTGIQQLTFNTIYQLFAHDREERARADQVLLVPDYLYFRLSGRRINEVTNASTTQLLNLQSRDYDAELLSILGMRREQFAALTEPGTPLGGLDPALQQRYDLPLCSLVVAATHDTASAVLGVPAREGSSWAYLSSGLWLIQEVRRQSGDWYSFAELVQMAEQSEPYRSLIDCNDDRFLNPPDMAEEIRRFCRDTGQMVPESVAQVARCIFDSLALSYGTYLDELEALTGEPVEVLHIVGGGAKNELLCQLTADATGREVCAGPVESTALGNLMVQMIQTGVFSDIHEARRTVAESFEVTRYKPGSLAAGVKERWNGIVKK
ncbi:hypothetical protein BGX30_004558 [Mortierella sp. GBA39]|nr:hypothetical protein BGX30_004558 [Mortierella sp. GBA39]